VITPRSVCPRAPYSKAQFRTGSVLLTGAYSKSTARAKIQQI